MKLLLIRQSPVSRSHDMRFKRAVRLSGEFFKEGSENHGAEFAAALIEWLAKPIETSVA